MKKNMAIRFNAQGVLIALTAVFLLTASGCKEGNVKQTEKTHQSTKTAPAAASEPVSSAAVTSGLNHLGLTVKDLEATTSFFVDKLGWKRAGGVTDYPAIFVTDGAIFVTLWQAVNPETAIDFNRKTNVGLHHLALTVVDVETLEALHQTLKADPKTRIEFAPQLNGNGPTVHMMVYEPSGSRIEFAVPGGRKRGE